MKKRMKRAVSLAPAAAMALSLTACGNGSGSKEGTNQAVTKSGAASDGEVTLKLCWWGGDSRHEATEKAAEVFVVKYPNIKVECKYGAWTGWEEKQSLVIQGGNAADVMQINWNWITSYSGDGTNLANLEDHSEILDLAQSDQSSLEQCKADSKLMAVLVATAGRLFYQNKTTFNEVGCDISVDEASLLEAGAKLRAFNEGYYPLAMMEYDRVVFMVYYLESVYGRPWIGNGELQYIAEETQSAMDFMTKLEEAHVISTIATLQGDMADSLDKNAKIINGQCADVSEWDSAITKVQKAIVENTDKLGQELVIGGFIKFSDYNDGFTKISMALTVSANSAHPREAAMLINYLLNDREGIKICDTERGIPCSTQGAAVFEGRGIGGAPVMEANEKVLGYSKFPLNPMFEHNDLKANPDGIYYKVFGKLSAGDISSAKAIEDLMKGIDDCYNYQQCRGCGRHAACVKAKRLFEQEHLEVTV